MTFVFYHRSREKVRNESACQSMSTSALVGQQDAALRENTGVISEQKKARQSDMYYHISHNPLGR